MQELNNTERVERRAMCDAIIKDHKQWTDGVVFRCTNCGAREVISKKDLSKKCAFCGSGAVVALKDLPGIQPDSVLPFRITKQTAVANYKRWKSKRWFAPNAFKKQDNDAVMNPIYSPTWSFSANTSSMYQGQLGRTHTVHTRNGTRTTIRWFRVAGQVQQSYMDHFVQSGDRVNNANFSRLKPFDLAQIQVYRTEFLAGIVAEHYTRDIETCFSQFSGFVKADLRRRVISKYRADHVSHLDIQTQYNDRRFNYVLLPLYISHLDYKKKLYNFYINGQTGKIVGKYPKSRVKRALIGIGIMAGVGAVVFAVWFFGFR